MVGTRTLTCAALAVALAGCSGSGKAAVTKERPASSRPTIPSVFRLDARQPTDLSGPLSGGDQGHVRVLEQSGEAGNGARVALLSVPGVGTLHVRCSTTPTTSFVLTRWASGEGPPVVRHVHSVVSRPFSLSELSQIEMPPVPIPGRGPAAFDVWQVGVYSEAFSATTTVWSLAATRGGRCVLQAQGVLVSHGAWLRYAPRHG